MLRLPPITRTGFLAAARSRTISAKGLCGRRLRLRNSETAASLAASQASRKPPSPFTARILPSRNSARAWRMMGSESLSANQQFPREARATAAGAASALHALTNPFTSSNEGPQTAHAFGWA